MSKSLAAGRAPTPIEQQVESIAASLGLAAEKADASLTVGELIALLGQQSHTMVILVFSVLNMIPGPPGYGGTVAFAIMAVTIVMMVGKPLRVGGWLGARPLPARLVARMIDRLGFLARLLGGVSRPRLEMLAGPRATIPVGVFILIVSAPMVLPIPLINAVPNVGIAIICLARLNRDGLGMVIGMVVGVIGLGVAAAAIWGVVNLLSALMAA